jgi:hypothetical protein
MATKSKTRKKSVVRGKATAKKKARRTVLYSRSGTKLYAKRSKTGKFTDIQSYQRAHSADLKRTSKSERAARRKKKAATTAKATKKAKVTTAGAKKKVVRKAPAESAKRTPSPRIVRAAMTVKQIPRAQQSYAVKPKPVAAQLAVELAVPELAVMTSVQGEVPAGGE